ncbi:uncharacterized protein LOC122022927 [Zingiber officinale]|uniref:uncharacterized protein LOC122022927 n=1 Tax=Zingiber officinale TaxID=94328 RepID=UPI001C4C1540|nr:uncharacterized protein LOC122022927 [Zingiber officinale]
MVSFSRAHHVHTETPLTIETPEWTTSCSNPRDPIRRRRKLHRRSSTSAIRLRVKLHRDPHLPSHAEDENLVAPSTFRALTPPSSPTASIIPNSLPQASDLPVLLGVSRGSACCVLCNSQVPNTLEVILTFAQLVLMLVSIDPHRKRKTTLRLNYLFNILSFHKFSENSYITF